MLKKERAADMYRLSAYFIARTTSDLPLDLLLPLLFILIVYFMTGLRLTPQAFFLTMLIVFLCIVAAQVSHIPYINVIFSLQILSLTDYMTKKYYATTGARPGYWCYSDGFE